MPQPIIVNLYNDGEAEPYAANVDLAECFPDDPDAFDEARDALMSDGEHRVGGGAAPTIDIRLA